MTQSGERDERVRVEQCQMHTGRRTLTATILQVRAFCTYRAQLCSLPSGGSGPITCSLRVIVRRLIHADYITMWHGPER